LDKKILKSNISSMERELILSIETAVHGGSLSLLANQSEIGGWTGTFKISKAEDVLEQISNLLNGNNIEKTQIKIIGVSKGAGSLTGEKIGSALARGLAKSLNCRLFEVNVFESLLTETEYLSDGDYLTAVPSGRNQVQWQKFRIAGEIVNRIDNLQTSETGGFFTAIKNLSAEKVILASCFSELYREELPDNSSRIKIKLDSLAKLNALLISNCLASDNKLKLL